jgi:hypothetical protein
MWRTCTPACAFTRCRPSRRDKPFSSDPESVTKRMRGYILGDGSVVRCWSHWHPRGGASWTSIRDAIAKTGGRLRQVACIRPCHSLAAQPANNRRGLRLEPNQSCPARSWQGLGREGYGGPEGRGKPRESASSRDARSPAKAAQRGQKVAKIGQMRAKRVQPCSPCVPRAPPPSTAYAWQLCAAIDRLGARRAVHVSQEVARPHVPDRSGRWWTFCR